MDGKEKNIYYVLRGMQGEGIIIVLLTTLMHAWMHVCMHACTRYSSIVNF